MSILGSFPLNNFKISFHVSSRIRTGAWRSWETVRTFSSTHTRLASEEDFANARKWLQNFNDNSIPQSIGVVTYSRSSGPGGQNVNKVNSKAQLRVPLDRLLPLVPIVLHGTIRASRYYADKTGSLVIQADDSRKQGTNKDACYKKLHDVIEDAGKRVVPGETSQEQKDKVRTLKQYENEARMKSKKQQSSKKAARSKSFGD